MKNLLIIQSSPIKINYLTDDFTAPHTNFCFFIINHPKLSRSNALQLFERQDVKLLPPFLYQFSFCKFGSFRFITKQIELLPGVFLFPSIDIINQADTHFERFWVQQEDGCKIPDTFQDELAVVLVEPEGFSVLSACSHRGITNILRTVQAAFPESPCKLLLGGFHIHNAEKQKYQVIADYLQEYLPRQIGVCHCTGVDKYAFFYKDFGDNTFYNYTGKLIQTDLSE